MIINFRLKQLQNLGVIQFESSFGVLLPLHNSLLAKVNLAMFRKLQCRYSILFLRWTSYSQELVAFYGRILLMLLLSGRWVFWEVYFSRVVACSQSQCLYFQLPARDYFLKQPQNLFSALCLIYLCPWLLPGQVPNWSYLTGHWHMGGLGQ